MRKEVEEAIEALKRLDLSLFPYNEIITQIAKVGVIGHMAITLHPGKRIFRARLNENGEHFFSKCQLTYKPQQFNNTVQRASTPQNSMFYGSILPEEINEDEIDEVRVTPSYEAIAWLRDKTKKGVKRITYTKWIVTQDIKLIAILQHGNFYDRSSYTRRIMNVYSNHLNQFPDKKEDTIAFMSFMAGEFAKVVDSDKNYNYLISAAFTENIINNGFDGILYPSVRLDGKGFNVALTPLAADTKIFLEMVTECKAYKLFDKTVLDNELRAILYENQTHFTFQKELEYHAGELNCLNVLGIKSIEELNSTD
jgi:hypothetical protein